MDTEHDSQTFSWITNSWSGQMSPSRTLKSVSSDHIQDAKHLHARIKTLLIFDHIKISYSLHSGFEWKQKNVLRKFLD